MNNYFFYYFPIYSVFETFRSYFFVGHTPYFCLSGREIYTGDMLHSNIMDLSCNYLHTILMHIIMTGHCIFVFRMCIDLYFPQSYHNNLSYYIRGLIMPYSRVQYDLIQMRSYTCMYILEVLQYCPLHIFIIWEKLAYTSLNFLELIYHIDK